MNPGNYSEEAVLKNLQKIKNLRKPLKKSTKKKNVTDENINTIEDINNVENKIGGNKSKKRKFNEINKNSNNLYI